MLIPTTQFAQSKRKKDKNAVVAPPPERNQRQLSRYSKVITKDAITDEGYLQCTK
jgi:hypothetical protein